MDCELFRERLGADPASLDEAGITHERGCTACAAYAKRLRASEALIADALRFDVARIKAKLAATKATAAERRRGPWYAAAAAVAAAVAVWLGTTFVPSTDPNRLAIVVQDHWHHEPAAWVRTDAAVSPVVVAAALGGQARVDLERLNVVSYARSCLVNGHWVPHLVVQGEAGPIMVLLLPREHLSAPLPLELPEDGLRGELLPLDSGSVAILGAADESFESVRQAVTDAVEWTT
jgi:hypothetical protein